VRRKVLELVSVVIACSYNLQVFNKYSYQFKLPVCTPTLDNVILITPKRLTNENIIYEYIKFDYVINYI
jgi:hypothetical protein